MYVSPTTLIRMLQIFEAPKRLAEALRLCKTWRRVRRVAEECIRALQLSRVAGSADQP